MHVVNLIILYGIKMAQSVLNGYSNALLKQ
jgi:hypothetical protein